MSKLTVIKHQYELLTKNSKTKLAVLTLEELGYLLSLLEEKDKALESSKEAIEHMLREQPNEMWTNQEVESWESIGTETLKEIDKALNTSSNNEGEL